MSKVFKSLMVVVVLMFVFCGVGFANNFMLDDFTFKLIPIDSDIKIYKVGMNSNSAVLATESSPYFKVYDISSESFTSIPLPKDSTNDITSSINCTSLTESGDAILHYSGGSTLSYKYNIYSGIFTELDVHSGYYISEIREDSLETFWCGKSTRFAVDGVFDNGNDQAYPSYPIKFGSDNIAFDSSRVWEFNPEYGSYYITKNNVFIQDVRDVTSQDILVGCRKQNDDLYGGVIVDYRVGGNGISHIYMPDFSHTGILGIGENHNISGYCYNSYDNKYFFVGIYTGIGPEPVPDPEPDPKEITVNTSITLPGSITITGEDVTINGSILINTNQIGEVCLNTDPETKLIPVSTSITLPGMSSTGEDVTINGSILINTNQIGEICP